MYVSILWLKKSKMPMKKRLKHFRLWFLSVDNYLKEHNEYKLVDYYIDDGYSSTNFNRPEFQRMLEDIKNKM